MKLNQLDKQGKIFRGQKLKMPNSDQSNTKTKWQVAEGGSPTPAEAVPHSGVQPRYFYTHENFYVITRYNQSVLYAMAVHDLSQALDKSWREKTDTALGN